MEDPDTWNKFRQKLALNHFVPPKQTLSQSLVSRASKEPLSNANLCAVFSQISLHLDKNEPAHRYSGLCALARVVHKSLLGQRETIIHILRQLMHSHVNDSRRENREKATFLLGEFASVLGFSREFSHPLACVQLTVTIGISAFD